MDIWFPAGDFFRSFLVEDKAPGVFSYVEFLVHVHRQIQSKMTWGPKILVVTFRSVDGLYVPREFDFCIRRQQSGDSISMWSIKSARIIELRNRGLWCLQHRFWSGWYMCCIQRWEGWSFSFCVVFYHRASLFISCAKSVGLCWLEGYRGFVIKCT
jgi:hypothetical protein